MPKAPNNYAFPEQPALVSRVRWRWINRSTTRHRASMTGKSYHIITRFSRPSGTTRCLSPFRRRRGKSPAYSARGPGGGAGTASYRTTRADRNVSAYWGIAENYLNKDLTGCDQTDSR